MIEKLGNVFRALKIEKRTPQNKIAKENPIAKTPIEDTVVLSQEALQLREKAVLMQKIREIPDIRQDRIKEVKEKLEKGAYDNLSEEILDKIAEKILRGIGGG